MVINGVKVPDIFIKACGEKTHAKDVVSGNIYMKKNKLLSLGRKSIHGRQG